MAMTYLKATRTRHPRASWTSQGRRYSDEVWQVRFTGTFDAYQAMTSPPAGVPSQGLTPLWDSDVLCEEVRAEISDDAMATTPAGSQGSVYTYIAQYGTLTDAAVQRVTPPLSRPPEIEGGGSDITEVRLRDATGAPMVNSAGEFYQGLPAQFVRAWAGTIAWNVANNPITFATTISNSTNQAIWNGVAAGNGKIGVIRHTKVVEVVNGVQETYWRVTAPIAFRRDGWALKLLDVGFSTRSATSGGGGGTVTGSLAGGLSVVWDRRLIVDGFGQPVQTPQFLDGSGGRGNPDSPVYFPADGYKTLEPANWGAWSIPSPFA